MAVVYRAFKKPRDFSRSPSMTFSFIVKWILHPLLWQAMMSPRVIVTAIRIILSLRPHLFVVADLSVIAVPWVRTMSYPLRICCDACSARIPIDDVLPLSQDLL